MRARDQKGFAVTLELIVLLSVFGTVALFAMSAVDQFIVDRVTDFFSDKIYIFDNTAGIGDTRLIGKAVGLNENEAPFVIIRDPDPDFTNEQPMALLGVRAKGFTSRMRVYYDDLACRGNAYLLDPGDSDWGTVTDSQIGETQPVADIYALQGTAYAIGSSGDSDYGIEGNGVTVLNGGVLNPVNAPFSLKAYCVGCNNPGSGQVLFRAATSNNNPGAIYSWWESEGYIDAMSPYAYASLTQPGRCMIGSINSANGSPNDLFSAGELLQLVQATAVTNATGDGTLIADYDSFLTEFSIATDFWVPAGTTIPTITTGSASFGSFPVAGTEATRATATSTDASSIAPGTEATNAKSLTVTAGETTAPTPEKQ